MCMPEIVIVYVYLITQYLSTDEALEAKHVWYCNIEWTSECSLSDVRVVGFNCSI